MMNARIKSARFMRIVYKLADQGKKMPKWIVYNSTISTYLREQKARTFDREKD